MEVGAGAQAGVEFGRGTNRMEVGMAADSELDEKEEERIFQEMMEELRAMRGSWEDSGTSDPGIMILEIISHLIRIQQEYESRIGVTAFCRMAGLLGVPPLSAEPAGTVVCFAAQRDRRLNAGVRLFAENTVYETEEPVPIWANRIEAFGGLRKGEWFVRFREPLKAGEHYSLYFDISDGLSCARTPITDIKHFIPFCELRWEYNGMEAEILRDDTVGFLFSGLATVKIPEKVEGKCGSELRIRAVRYGYEAEPVIRRVYLNCVHAVQKRTLAKRIGFSAREFRENRMLLSEELAADGKYEVYLKDGDGWRRAEDLDVDYLIKRLPDGGFRLGTSKRAELLERYGAVSDEEEVLTCALYDRDYFERRIPGSGSGMANQEFRIADRGETALRDGCLMAVGRNGRFRDWKPFGRYEAAGGNAEGFWVNESEGTIRFGDNIQGKTPYRGVQNLVITGLAVTEAENGNSQPGRITEFYRKDEYPGAGVMQITKAEGGRREETAAALKERLRRYGKETESAVTVQDYERLAGRTQGLKIGGVTAVPGYAPGISFPETTAENTVTLVIEPAGNADSPLCAAGYAENVRRQMESKRLLTTKLFVEPVRYFGLTVEGEIVIFGEKNRAQAALFSVLEEYLQKANKGRSGGRLDHGEICGLLEGLPFVKTVEELYLGAQGAGVRNRLGDILIVPYGKVYLKEMKISLSETVT